MVVAVVAVRHEPAFYRSRLAAGRSPEAARAARRLVTKVAAVQAAAGRPGPWELAITDEEFNAWLALDLPRNHARVLDEGVVDPRIAFDRRRLAVASRVQLGPLEAVGSLALDVRLREPNQIELAVADARLGAIPLPHGPVLRWLAGVATPLGLVAEVRRLDGRGVLVVSMILPSAPGAGRPTLVALALEPGELLAGGETREGR